METTTADPGPFYRPIRDVFADLKKPLPARLHRTKKVPTKKGGSYEATYTHHTTIRDLLDHYAPGWTWETKIAAHDGLLYVVGTLTVWGTDDTGRVVSVSRDGLGNEDSDLDGYGDPSSNAEAQALRRAAMAMGLDRDLWRPR